MKLILKSNVFHFYWCSFIYKFNSLIYTRRLLQLSMKDGPRKLET